ncbi:SHOCT domain-containing protein [Streptomyces sp. NPDC002659]|uniref:SHOCT domain-containing protein n=1 Tax=Streptomyces sp. NPDC002659 TaxID=3364656 RepID=UPI0036BCE8C8
MTQTIRHRSEAAQATAPATAVGPVVFAAVMLIITSVMDLLRGIMGIAEDDIFVKTPNYTFQYDVTGWGWIHLILGAVAILVGIRLRRAWHLGRIIGVTVAGMLIITNFLSLPYYPIWSVISIALYAFIIWALTAADAGGAKSGVDELAKYSELARLSELKAKGDLTEEEFQRAKVRAEVAGGTATQRLLDPSLSEEGRPTTIRADAFGPSFGVVELSATEEGWEKIEAGMLDELIRLPRDIVESLNSDTALEVGRSAMLNAVGPWVKKSGKTPSFGNEAETLLHRSSSIITWPAIQRGMREELAKLPNGIRPSQDTAHAEGRQAMRQAMAPWLWANSVGPRLNTAEVLGLLAITETQLERAVEEGELIVLPGRTTALYPTWQFDLERRVIRPEVAEILRAFDPSKQGADPYVVAPWANARSTELDDRSPAEILGAQHRTQRDIALVLKDAQHFAARLYS